MFCWFPLHDSIMPLAPYMCMYAVQSHSVLIIYIILWQNCNNNTELFSWQQVNFKFRSNKAFAVNPCQFAASSKAHSGYGPSQDVALKRSLILVYPIPKIILDWVLLIIKIYKTYLGSIYFFYFPLWYFQFNTTYHYWIQQLPDACPSLCNLHTHTHTHTYIYIYIYIYIYVCVCVCVCVWHPLLSARNIGRKIQQPILQTKRYPRP